MYFQLHPSTLPIEETEFGLLLTPNLVQIAETPEKYQERQKKRTEQGLNQAPHPNNKYNCLLSQVLYSGMMLTPSTVDIVPSDIRFQKRTEYRNSVGRKWSPGSLTEQIFHGMLPTPRAQEPGSTSEGYGACLTDIVMGRKMLNTPTASDKNGGVTRPTEKLQYGTSLVNQMHGLTNGTPGTTSQLSPQFVLEMMGFPTDWTLLPFLNGETNQSKQEETQSFPK
jgi:site-specific DNA-cytosine methylase